MKRFWIGLVAVVAVLGIGAGSTVMFDRYQRTFDTIDELVANGGPKSQHKVVTVLGTDGGVSGIFVSTNSATGTNGTSLIYSGTSGWSWLKASGNALSTGAILAVGNLSTNSFAVVADQASTNTPIVLNINGTQKRVHVGAVDTGGTGLRALTVEN